MRLINTESLSFENFSQPDAPSYAILSHTWLSDEVSYRDVLHTEESKLQSAATNQKAGSISKMVHACRRAKIHNLGFLWIDNCCIDHLEPGELSQAINSMFEWYEQAAVCYVYLQDVTCSKAGKLDTLRQFQESVWFHRGWTLQELLAPTKLEFYDSQWQFIGTKATLETEIERATGIEAQYLDNFRSASVAQRMSWASTRRTTRVEDGAYCMLGIFGVNMDLRYGEGERAFQRLQEELIKMTDDESIFAWRSDGETTYGLLAPSPQCFKDSMNIICSSQKRKPRTPPYQMTNRGLEFSIPKTSGIFRRFDQRDQIEVQLNCWQAGQVKENTVTIVLEKIEGDVWQRLHCDTLHFRNGPASNKHSVRRPSTVTLYIPQVRHSQFGRNRN